MKKGQMCEGVIEYIDFPKYGPKKMFAGFAKLKKV